MKQLTNILNIIKTYWGYAMTIMAIGATVVARDARMQKKAVEQYLSQVKQVSYEAKIDKLIESDSILNISFNILSLEIQDNTRETKVNTKAIANHLENERAWQELVDFWRDQAQNRVIENNSEVPKGIPGIKNAGILIKPGVRKATIVENDSLNKLYGRGKIR